MAIAIVTVKLSDAPFWVYRIGISKIRFHFMQSEYDYELEVINDISKLTYNQAQEYMG